MLSSYQVGPFLGYQRHIYLLLGDQRHDQKEFVWTLHKSRDDWESKIKWPNNNNDNNNNIWQL